MWVVDELSVDELSVDELSVYNLLPPKKHTVYNMRQRVHNFVIPTRQSKLRDSNFIVRMLQKGTY